MKNFAFESWDDGRITVNAAFANVLREHNLTTFAAVMQKQGETAKNLLKERTTVRLTLPAGDGIRELYLKRHLASPWKEYVKPWLRFARPILGAKNEWNAILDFHRAGIPTMTPVAIGQNDRESFLITEGIAGCRKLSDWMSTRFGAEKSVKNLPQDRETGDIIDGIATVARRMHTAGLHHQDFYLTHLLQPMDNSSRGIHVIDLGRAKRSVRLSRRWIVKDLAQLNYSANLLPAWTRTRFLETYFGRPVCASDKSLLRRIDAKTARIARHSQKHRL